MTRGDAHIAPGHAHHVSAAYNRAANRRPLPTSMFTPMSGSTNSSACFSTVGSNRRASTNSSTRFSTDVTNRRASANDSAYFSTDRTNRREMLENVFLGQPISTSYMTVPTKIAKRKSLRPPSRQDAPPQFSHGPPSTNQKRRQSYDTIRSQSQALLSKVCFNCGHTRMSVDMEEKINVLSQSDVDTYCSDSDINWLKQQGKDVGFICFCLFVFYWAEP